MAPTLFHDTRNCLLVARIPNVDPASPPATFERCLDDIDTALELISKELGNGTFFAFALDMSPDNEVSKSGGEFDPPEHATNPEFWLNIHKQPSLHRRIAQVLARFEQLLIAAQDHQRSTESLWESDEFQFGEPPLATFMALLDVRFVPPAYTRLLRQWDMLSEVMQAEAITLMIERHGICPPEIEELLVARVAENPGQASDDQLEELIPPLLDKAYGSYAGSALEQRINGSR